MKIDIEKGIHNTNKKKYAIGMLVYPGRSDPKWNYLFGACMISHQLKKNKWFQENCDIIVLTPVIYDKHITTLINNIFDFHATYHDNLSLVNPFETNPRWYGVFNKLYFWNSDIFNYKRLLILDTDIFITDPQKYIKLFIDIKGSVAGCYENNFRNKNKDIDLSFGSTIHSKYTSYIWDNNKSYYNMVNAGVMSIIPDVRILNVMLYDIHMGWDYISQKYQSLKGKKDTYFFPEQEYLTGFFSGQWISITMDYISCQTTCCHYNSGSKFWNNFPNPFGSYAVVSTESSIFFNKFPEYIDIFANVYKLLIGLPKTDRNNNYVLNQSKNKKKINDIVNIRRNDHDIIINKIKTRNIDLIVTDDCPTLFNINNKNLHKKYTPSISVSELSIPNIVTNNHKINVTNNPDDMIFQLNYGHTNDFTFMDIINT